MIAFAHPESSEYSKFTAGSLAFHYISIVSVAGHIFSLYISSQVINVLGAINLHIKSLDVCCVCL